MPSISSFQISGDKLDFVSPLSQYGIPYLYSSIPVLNSGGDRKCLACAIRQTPDIFKIVSESGPGSVSKFWSGYGGSVGSGGSGSGGSSSSSSVTLPVIPPLPIPPPIYFSISWVTTHYGTLDGNPWTITLGGNSIRFSVEDSANCGGLNDQVQGGTATATIQTGAQSVLFDLLFSGIAELEDSGFENITFLLDSVAIASATSQNLNLGCAMGPVNSTFLTSFPILLSANSIYTLEVNFDTGDALYHVGSYYQIDLSFSPV